MVLTCWFAAYKNPSILGIIECISGPTGAAILLLLPMYAIHKLPVLAPWRGKASNVFVTLNRSYHRICHFLRHVPITTIISEMLYESLSAD
ncbi:serine transporter [Klebsiella pneumoniae]|nr:serine transporter [Klebsiella pneumoniae]